VVPHIFPHPLNRTGHLQPTYIVARSFVFQPSLYPGYAHRRTIGWKEGISTDGCEDVFLSASERKKRRSSGDKDDGDVKAGEARTWELVLKRD
jgi:25S rRNA (uracil2634-N3)-methyltransferase